MAKTRSDGMRSKGFVSRGQEGRVARTELVSQLTISADRPQNHDRDASSVRSLPAHVALGYAKADRGVVL